MYSPSGLVPEGPQIVSVGVRGRNHTEWFHWVRTLEELQMERPINTCRVTVFRAHGEWKLKSGVGVLQQTEMCNTTSVDVPSCLNFESSRQNTQRNPSLSVKFPEPSLGRNQTLPTSRLHKRRELFGGLVITGSDPKHGLNAIERK